MLTKQENLEKKTIKKNRNKIRYFFFKFVLQTKQKNSLCFANWGKKSLTSALQSSPLQS